MPVYPCAWPTCAEYVERRGDHCADHAAVRVDQATRERARIYNRFVRDPEAVKFYNSAEWKRARSRKLAHDPVCERCLRVFARHVHHRKPLEQCTPEQRTALAYLESLCIPCHNVVEKAKESA
jgi:hypothetical protein